MNEWQTWYEKQWVTASANIYLTKVNTIIFHICEQAFLLGQKQQLSNKKNVYKRTL